MALAKLRKAIDACSAFYPYVHTARARIASRELPTDCKPNRGLIEATIRADMCVFPRYDALDILRSGIAAMRAETRTGEQRAKTVEANIIGAIERRTCILCRPSRICVLGRCGDALPS